MAVFVPFVLPGEKVEAEIQPGKAGFARANVTALVAASNERIEPPCPYFKVAEAVTTSTFPASASWNSRRKFCARLYSVSQRLN